MRELSPPRKAHIGASVKNVSSERVKAPRSATPSMLDTDIDLFDPHQDDSSDEDEEYPLWKTEVQEASSVLDSIEIFDQHKTDVPEKVGRSTGHLKTQVNRTRPSERGFVLDLQGNIVEPRMLISDIMTAGKKFLTSNHLAVKTLHGAEVVAIPEMFNLQRMQAAQRSIGLVPWKCDILNSPEDVIGTAIRSLDYIFGEPVQPGPKLRFSIALGSEMVSDLPEHIPDELTVANMMRDPHRAVRAPYAFSANGQAYPEWKSALEKYAKVVGATEEDIQNVAPRGFEIQKPWPENKIKLAREQRLAKFTEEKWIITLVVPIGFTGLFICDSCDRHVLKSRKSDHEMRYHSRKQMTYTQVVNPANTLQIDSGSNHPKKEYQFTLSKDAYPDGEMVLLIARELVNFYNRWPCIFHRNTKMSVLALVCDRLRQQMTKAPQDSKSHVPPVVSLARPLYMPPASASHRQGHTQTKDAIQIAIDLFDPITLAPYRKDAYFLPMAFRSVKGAPHIPDVPDHILWTGRQQERIAYVEIPEDQDPHINSAVRLAKFVSYQLSGKLISEKASNVLLRYYRRFFCSSVEAKNREFKLFNVLIRPRNGCTEIHPNRRLQRLYTGMFPRVILYSTNGTLIASALDNAHNVFCQEADPVATWTALCRVADTMNRASAAGETPRREHCRCIEDSRTMSFHHCARCFGKDLCAFMEESTSDCEEQERICRRCINDVLLQNYNPSQQLYKNLRHIVRDEFEAHNSTASVDEMEKFIKTTCNQADQPFRDDNGVWYFNDIYTDSAPIKLPSEAPKRDERRLFFASYDAIFPYSHFTDDDGNQKRAIHGGSNLALTTLGFNLGKQTFLPAILHLASVCWSYARPPYSQEVPVEELYAHILKQAADMQMVHVQTPYTRKGRYAESFDKSHYDDMLKQWIQASPISDERRMQSKRLIESIDSLPRQPQQWEGLPRDWHERLHPIIQQMQAHFGRKLPRSPIDDFPFPGTALAMPQDWCAWRCWAFFSARVALMWEWCNGMWEQVDTTETLFLTSCYFALDSDRKEFLNLPWVFSHRNPLRITIGHEKHGFQLRSGFSVPFPSTLAQWKPELNNLSIETAFSNFLKTNGTTKDCDAIRDHLLHVNLAEHIYNPLELLRPAHRHGPQYKGWSTDRHVQTSPIIPSASALAPDQIVTKEKLRQNDENDEVGIKTMQPITSAVTPVGKRLTVTRSGFENPAQYCWLISALQFLYTIQPFRAAILSVAFQNADISDQYLAAGMRVIAELRSVFQMIGTSPHTAIDPQPLMKTLADLQLISDPTRHDVWSGDEPEDVHEFVSWLFQQVTFDLGIANSLNACQQDLVEMVNWKCVQCGTDPVNKPVNPCPAERVLSFKIPAKTNSANHYPKSLSISKLVAAYFQPEDMELRAACAQDIPGHGTRERIYRYDKMPEYMICHISRNSDAIHHRISTHITQHQTLDLGTYAHNDEDNTYYELEAEVRHKDFGIDDTRLGHYFTYVRSDAKWFKCDDTQITLQSPFIDTRDGVAVLLLYRRQMKPTIHDLPVSMSAEHLKCAKALRELFGKGKNVPYSGSDHMIWTAVLEKVAREIFNDHRGNIWRIEDNAWEGASDVCVHLCILDDIVNVATTCYLLTYAEDGSSETVYVSIDEDTCIEMDKMMQHLRPLLRHM